MFGNFKMQIGKLAKFVEEETSLDMEVNATSYPLRISFYHQKEQLSIFDNTEAAANNQTIDAASGEIITPTVTFEFYEKMRIVTAGKVKISDAIFSKLKTLSKEANRIFLNEFCEAMIAIREDLREIGWAEQIGNEIDAADGVRRIMCIVNPTVLIEYLDWGREGRVHGAEVYEDIYHKDESAEPAGAAEEPEEEDDEGEEDE